jgi:hypothetical protein
LKFGAEAKKSVFYELILPNPNVRIASPPSNRQAVTTRILPNVGILNPSRRWRLSGTCAWGAAAFVMNSRCLRHAISVGSPHGMDSLTSPTATHGPKSRCVAGKDKVAIFDWGAATRALLNFNIGELAVIELRKSAAVGRRVLFLAS